MQSNMQNLRRWFEKSNICEHFLLAHKYLISRTYQSGFTLVELLVSTTLLVMLMTTVTVSFMTFLVASAKIKNIENVKQEGDFALNQMEFLLRNSLELVPNSQGKTCEQGMSEISFLSFDERKTSLFRELDTESNTPRVASNSGVYLTSSKLELVDPSLLSGKTANPQFDCSTSQDGNTRFVTINLTLRKGVPDVDKPTEIIEQTFTSGVTLRNN